MKRLTVSIAISVFAAGFAAEAASSEGLSIRQGFLAFQPKVGFVLPTGSYRDVSHSGIGLQGTVEYYLTNRFSVGASINFTQSSATAEAIRAQATALSSPGGNSAVAHTFNRPAPNTEEGRLVSTTTNPVTISSWKRQVMQYGAYGRYLMPIGSASFSPYVSAGLGIYNVGGSVAGSGATKQELEQATNSQGRTSLGMNLGGGVMFNVAPAVGLVAGISYHNAFSSPATNYFQINTGLNFFFNPGR
ncbi:MAG: porin family protein [candidate division Zixibacteria bacterium]|nr:porin family protein [candidate division Zixibacteria bacterium]